MSRASDARVYKALSHRKSRDRALVLPLVGLLLFLPPVAGIFQIDALVFGVPITLVYLFSVWAVLIAAALVLSRRLRPGSERSADPSPRDPAESRKRYD